MCVTHTHPSSIVIRRYPHGPARNPTSVQRGSVQYLSMYPGDPTTPGYPAYSNSTRTSGKNIPSIPSLPISWENGERLLSAVGQKVRLLNNGIVSRFFLKSFVVIAEFIIY
jgi:hypothetical protein